MRRFFQILLPLMALLSWGVTAVADYDPANPPEPQVTYSLTAGCIPAGGGRDISGAGKYAAGTSVQMNVGVNTGFRFLHWEDEEGNIVSTATRFNFVIPQRDVNLTARFEYVPSNPSEPETPVIKQYSAIHLKSVPSEGGTFNKTSGQTYEVGTSQEFRATARTNYRFVNWTLDDDVVSESSTLQFTIPSEDKTLVANFDYNPGSPAEPEMTKFSRTLTLVSNPPEAATLSGGGSYVEGTVKKVSASVNRYYTFINWTAENGDTVSTVKDFEFTMPDHDVTLTANFSRYYNPLNPEEPGSEDSSSATIVQNPRFAMYDDFHVMILCATQGSSIHYTIDGSEPSRVLTDECMLYTEPFFVPSNLLVKAIAFKDGMEDSPVISYQVMTYKAAQPSFSFSGRKLHITCDTEDTTVRYTLNEYDPNESSSIYTEPFLPETNCLVKAYASKEGLVDSPITEFLYKKENYTLPAPAMTNDYRNSRIAIESEDCDLAVTIDGDYKEYHSPVVLEVDSSMHSVSAVAIDKTENFFDSPQMDETLVFHLPPVVTYDGHQIVSVVADEDPDVDSAEINVHFNGDEIEASHIFDDFGNYEAYVASDNIFRSASYTCPIDYFNNGSKAGVRNGHKLAEAFEDWKNDEGYPELTITGDIAKEDLEFLVNLDELSTLQLESVRMGDSSYIGAMKGSKIKTVLLSQTADGLLDEMSRLTSVVWLNRKEKMPKEIFGEKVNPNLLVWVSDKILAPDSVGNIIIYGLNEDGTPKYAEGRADSISLVAGFPYNAYAPLDVDYIQFCKNFTQPTEIDVCRGWETIALPFAPDTIFHKMQGEIWPYSRWKDAYTKGEFGEEGPKPFWIYKATPEGWSLADTIESGVPYIISMPNSKDYKKAFNLKGESVFAAHNVRIGESEDDGFPYECDWINGTKLHATFMPVDTDHLSLNNEWTDAVGDVLPGSVFIDDAETLPFEAYVTGNGKLQRIPLFGTSKVHSQFDDNCPDISISVLGNGSIRISSSTTCSIDIYTPTGLKIQSVLIGNGEELVDNLCPGIYIIAGQKIIIK